MNCFKALDIGDAFLRVYWHLFVIFRDSIWCWIRKFIANWYRACMISYLTLRNFQCLNNSEKIVIYANPNNKCLQLNNNATINTAFNAISVEYANSTFKWWYQIHMAEVDINASAMVVIDIIVSKCQTMDPNNSLSYETWNESS